MNIQINNNIAISTRGFAGGERHIQLANLPDKLTNLSIRAFINSSDDLLDLLLLQNALDNHYGYKVKINLQLPYLPYARQDRVCATEQAFSMQVMAQLLQLMHLQSLTTWDCHSAVGLNLTHANNIEPAEIIKQSQQLSNILQIKDSVLICPDSGDPVKIICGDEDAPAGSPEYKGAVECLWEIFAGEISDKGYKLLNERVGLIYGDSITLERTRLILEKLEAKGFASSNIVFGIGSYTYQYLTRDTFGFAMKATWGQVNGESREIFKDPKTDKGDKKSAKGLLRIEKTESGFELFDQQTKEQENQGELKTVFADGRMHNRVSFDEIRARMIVN